MRAKLWISTIIGRFTSSNQFCFHQCSEQCIFNRVLSVFLNYISIVVPAQICKLQQNMTFLVPKNKQLRYYALSKDNRYQGRPQIFSGLASDVPGHRVYLAKSKSFATFARFFAGSSFVSVTKSPLQLLLDEAVGILSILSKYQTISN